MTASIDETTTVEALRGFSPRSAEVTELDKVRTERLVAGQQRRAAARSRDLTALLRERPDLHGVHAPADFAVESVHWTV
jgi:hypothetical protein